MNFCSRHYAKKESVLRAVLCGGAMPLTKIIFRACEEKIVNKM